jgi:hypothetical protein
VSLTKRDQDDQQRAELKKTAKVRQIVRGNPWLAVKSIAEQANIDRERGKS